MEANHSNTTTPTGSPKRPTVNVQSPSPSKRTRADGPAVDTRDDEFWYIDGTVVIRVNKTLFRVHASRLGQYCVYFQKLFEPGANAGQNETIDDCPVYHVPSGLSPKGFKDVLKALDTPLYVVPLLPLSRQRTLVLTST
ncbi:hypothetical protein LXA43DRAFT_1034496 [Ganoderma leucocontextum]|nr:hypothetical protein LXA43DRAFT_1034496 [Ganoderma leucocontextum]